MKKIKSLLLIAFIGLCFHNATAQLNVSYTFCDLSNKVGIGYDIGKIFSVDAYLYSAGYFSDMSPEFTVRANILNKDTYKLYLGAGFVTNRLSSVVFPVGIKVTPFFRSFPKLSFKIDVNIMAGIDNNPNSVIPCFGICYSLW
jgi:hypothetical protein